MVSLRKRQYKLTKCCTELKSYTNSSNDKSIADRERSQSELVHYDAKNYYQRRIARILPLFYLTNIIAIPLQYGGYGWFVPGTWDYYIVYPLTVFAANTWFIIGGEFNGPSWFVSTMVFFYWIFPSLLPRLQRYSIQQKQIWVHGHYWLNIIIAIVIAGLFTYVADGALIEFLFTASTFWPVSRLPVFIMGLLAGLLRVEGGMNALTSCCKGKTEEHWQRRSSWLGIWICVLFIICGCLEAVYHPGFAFWLQIFIAWWLLEFIWALTCDGDNLFGIVYLQQKLHYG